MTVWALVAAVVLLAANAFFVAVEFALLAASRSVVETLAITSRRARSALGAMSDLNRQLSAAQLGITMASLGLGFVAEPAVADVIDRAIESFGDLPSGLRHTISFTIALSLVAFVHMVLGEMVPKNLALAGAERVVVWLAPPHAWFVRVLAPVIWAVNATASGIVRLVGIEPTDELVTAHTPEELSSMVDASRGEGLIGEFSHGLLSGALEFGSRSVESVMVGWADVVTVSRASTVAELERIIVESGHSRLPVIGLDGDKVEGYIHAKDLLRIPESVRAGGVPASRIHPMVVLGPSSSLADALVAMRGQRSHVALVRTDGRPVGLVTLEDVVEQVVGDIRDETDVRTRSS
ncbi:MAG: hemolysin family protein [Acidimicrobiia bacterium]|nr:hemolysin family protein [Acidimicrobiia bacterium]